MNNEMITIQAPRDNDEAQWKKLYHEYAQFYNVPMNEEILKNLWGWINDESNPFYCLIAKQNQEQLLGFMHFRAMPSPLRGKMVGFLDDLYICNEARGKGVVDLLYGELANQGKKNNWPYIRWITADDNYRARSVYDKIATKTQWNTYQMDLGKK